MPVKTIKIDEYHLGRKQTKTYQCINKIDENINLIKHQFR